MALVLVEDFLQQPVNCSCFFIFRNHVVIQRNQLGSLRSRIKNPGSGLQKSFHKRIPDFGCQFLAGSDIFFFVQEIGKFGQDKYIQSHQ